MATPPVVHELTSRFRVPYPYIWVVTSEEQRALQLVRDAAEQAGLSVDVPAAPGAVARSPERADGGWLLARLRDIASTAGPGISVLADPHPYMRDPAVVRLLREMVPGLLLQRRCVVLVSPIFDVPPELDHEITVVHVPLPDEDELRAVLLRTVFERGVPMPSDEAAASVARAAKGLTLDEAGRAFARAALDAGLEGEEGVAAVAAEKQALLRRSELLEIVSDVPSLGEVGGLAELKRWLSTRASAFGDEARAYGLPQPRGLLLLGVQGCGKSLTAKAIAREWRLPLARFELAQLFAVGRSPEDNLRRVLRTAAALAPLVLWIDEIDKSFAGVGRGGGEALNRIFGSFITWLQEKREPVFVVATANGIEDLPPELLRKGRFDEIFFVDLPSRHEREAILRIHLAARGRDPARFDLTVVAERAEHFAGAELEQVVVSALYDAFAERRELDVPDLLRAVSETTPLYETYEEPIKRLREWATRRARIASGDNRLVDLFRRP